MGGRERKGKEGAERRGWGRGAEDRRGKSAGDNVKEYNINKLMVRL